MNCTHERKAIRPKGPHTEQYCLDCGAHLKFVPKIKTSDEAARFVMPIGMHKGKRIDEIPMSYICWAAKNVTSSSIQRACQAFLSGFNQFEIEEEIAREKE